MRRMITIKKWIRLIYIIYILNKYDVIKIIGNFSTWRIFKISLILNPWNYLKRNKLNRAVRLRLAFEALGPIFIKFGQALSTRRDLLPDDLSNELTKLQDKVPPFSSKQAVQVIEKTFKQSINELFSSFNDIPIASASIAQVHSATLMNGKEVVIKVLRPNIKNILTQDTQLLKTIAKLIEYYIPSTRRLRPIEVVAEITRNLLDEIDLHREAANASQLKRNFKDSDIHYVPEVYWQYCHSNILTIEKITGVPISDIQRLKLLNTDLKILAERGVEIFYTQVFRDCFFHADMHPGNIFVDVTDPRDPKYISIDFGIVGTLNREDQHYLANNFLAFFNHDYRRVAELHIESGWVPYNTRVDELESAIRTTCEPIFEKPLVEISFGYTLMRLFQVAKRFNMSVQPQLILLQKTLLNIEGLGRDLYPNLNLWDTAKPFLENWVKQRISWKTFLKRSIKKIPDLNEHLPEIPDLIFNLLNTKIHQSKLKNLQRENFKKIKFYQRRKISVILGITLISINFLCNYASNTIFILTREFIYNHHEIIGEIGIIIVLISIFLLKNKD